MFHSFTLTSSKYSLKESLNVLNPEIIFSFPAWDAAFLLWSAPQRKKICSSFWGVVRSPAQTTSPLGYRQSPPNAASVSSLHCNLPNEPPCPAIERDVILSGKNERFKTKSPTCHQASPSFSLTQLFSL